MRSSECRRTLTMKKRCSKCSREKNIEEFRLRLTSPDGRRGQCRECENFRALAYYRAHREASSKYKKAYYAKNREYWLLYRRRRYDQIGVSWIPSKASQLLSLRKWRAAHRVECLAHRILNQSVKTGKVRKPTACQSCGLHRSKLDGHHSDYSKPLDVRWLCHVCHMKLHKKSRLSLMDG